jgi:hypothetical protein
VRSGASETSSIVFLFNADADGVSDWYGGDFDPAFLRALSEADPTGITRTSVRRGDAIVSELAKKITSVTQDARSSSHVQSYDMEVFRTIIWDLADALSQQWTTLNLEKFPKILGRNNIHCISVDSLTKIIAYAIDRSLQKANGYLGAIELDTGSPIQMKIFSEFLIKDAALIDGQVVLELGWEGVLDTLFEGSNTFKPRGLRVVKYGKLKALSTEFEATAGLSPRGRISLERYSGKRKFTLQERVLAALACRVPLGDGRKSYTFDAGRDPTNPLEAELPESKFVRYLLDPNHPNGRSKAKFFRETLGIDAIDWRYLAAQLHDGLKVATLVELGVKNWQEGLGVTFNAVMPVVGRNGRIVAIDTNWIMEPGQQPRLSTAVPAKNAGTTIVGSPGVQPPVVSSDVVGDHRWEAIFQIASDAGKAAAMNVVPTPMRVQGYDIEMEGLCGNAWVRVKDARRGFARWAIRANHAYHHYKSGAQFFAKADSQSIDRAIAYATAFGEVLRHNGIDCTVSSRLD